MELELGFIKGHRGPGSARVDRGRSVRSLNERPFCSFGSGEEQDVHTNWLTQSVDPCDSEWESKMELSCSSVIV